MEEIWKDIPGYEGYYQASSLGRVKSMDRYVNGKIPGFKILSKGRILRPAKTTGDYLTICLSRLNKKKSYRLHVIIAKLFIPNPNNLPEVNHKDEDKTNNYTDNLEWCTSLYNNNYGTVIKRRTKITEEMSLAILSDNRIQKEIAKSYGINHYTVFKIKRGIYKNSLITN